MVHCVPWLIITQISMIIRSKSSQWLKSSRPEILLVQSPGQGIFYKMNFYNRDERFVHILLKLYMKKKTILWESYQHQGIISFLWACFLVSGGNLLELNRIDCLCLLSYSVLLAFTTFQKKKVQSTIPRISFKYYFCML